MRRRVIRPHQAAKDLTNDLTWEIQVESVSSGGSIADKYKALHRNDNGERLNIVKSSYNVATNDIFKDTVNRIAKNTGFDLHGYTEFGNGGVVLAYLKSPGGMKIGEFDSDNYLCIGNSFDYSKGFFSGLTNVVHRCSNQFSSIVGHSTIRHNSKMNEKLQELVLYYETYVAKEMELKKTFESWMGIQMSPELKELFVDRVLEINPNEKIVSSRKLNMKADLFVSVNREVNAMGNNLWATFNGLTHYTSHVKHSDKKVFGNVIGTLADLNTKGFKVATELLDLV